MKTKISALLLSILLLSVVGCQDENTIDDDNNLNKPKSIQLPVYASSVLKSSNAFGINLFTKVATDKDEQKNLMLSPLSANIALNMAMNGAAGTTFEQMRDMLGYKNLSQEQINELYQSLVKQLLEADNKVTLNLANAMFHKNGFDIKNNYINAMKNAYDADIEQLNFLDAENTLKRINGWASEKTNEKIDKVLSEISPMAVMFLLNAVYFKGNWTQKFNKESTQYLRFTLDDGGNVNVPTMMSKIKIKADVQGKFATYELSYGRDNFVMDIILPNGKLSNFINDFNAETYQNTTAALDKQSEKTEYDVLLPKFTFKYEKYLSKTLKSLGMFDAFSATDANFSKISDVYTYISFVKQNSFVDVNEEGTEAAAVTTIGINTTSAGPEKPSVHFDKPFIFLIREKTTNTLLFIGTVYNPLEE